MKKVFLIGGVILIIALAALLVSQNQVSHEESVAGEDGYTVRIGYLNVSSALPFFIAEEEGYFDEVGLEYETTVLSSSNQMTDALVADQIDVSVNQSLIPIFQASLQRPDSLKIFSVNLISQEHPFDAIMVPVESEVTSLSDLAELTIGVFPGTSATNSLDTFLIAEGVDTSNITYSPISPSSQIGALESGAVDALFAYEPSVSIAEVNGLGRVVHESVYASIINPNPLGVGAATSSFVSSHPEELALLEQVMHMAWDLIEEDPERALEIAVERFELDEEVADQMTLLPVRGYNDYDVVNLQSYADILFDIGELEEQIDISEMTIK